MTAKDLKEAAEQALATSPQPIGALTCPSCAGNKKTADDRECPTCKGNGTVSALAEDAKGAATQLYALGGRYANLFKKDFGGDEDIYVKVTQKGTKVKFVSASSDALQGTYMSFVALGPNSYKLDDFDSGKTGFIGRNGDEKNGRPYLLTDIDKVLRRYYQEWKRTVKSDTEEKSGR